MNAGKAKAPYVRVVVASRAVPRGYPLGKNRGRHRGSDNEQLF